MKYTVNSSGYYGDFGGAYIPEMLFSNIDELKKNYLSIVHKDSFNKEFNYYNYIGLQKNLWVKYPKASINHKPIRYLQNQLHHSNKNNCRYKICLYKYTHIYFNFIIIQFLWSI